MNLYKIRHEIMSGKSIYDIKLKVVYYARVSTEKDIQIHSLNNQKNFFEEYITNNPNWTLVGSYVDEGISGTSITRREDFIKMIKDSKNNLFDLIITKEISRFSRNTIDSIKYTELLLENGVGVYFLNDNINTILPDSELRLTIMASIAQDEIRKLSERVKFGMKRSITNGYVLGNSNITGYTKKNGKLRIDKNQSQLVKIIFLKYANTSMGLRKLSQYLAEKGYLNSKGKEIGPKVLKGIIENPKYKGFYCGNKTEILNYKTKEKYDIPKNEWIMYKDKSIPKLVTEKLWNKANEKLRSRAEQYAKNLTRVKENYAFSNKIICSIDNKIYYRNNCGNRKNNPVWECSKYRIEGKKGCNNIKLKEKELIKIMKIIYCEILDNDNIVFSELIEKLEMIPQKIIKTNKKTIDDIKNILEKTSNLLDNEFLFREITYNLLEKIVVEKNNTLKISLINSSKYEYHCDNKGKLYQI